MNTLIAPSRSIASLQDLHHLFNVFKIYNTRAIELLGRPCTLIAFVKRESFHSKNTSGKDTKQDKIVFYSIRLK